MELEIMEEAQEHIRRIGNEVIQHAKTVQYITEASIIRKEDFEQMVLDTYGILCQKVIHPKYKTPWRLYAGRHRNKVKQPYRGNGARIDPF